MSKPTWAELKRRGSEHYKSSGAEPIDLYKTLGILKIFSTASIIKYAFRSIRKGCVGIDEDMRKIKHYADLAAYNEDDG